MRNFEIVLFEDNEPKYFNIVIYFSQIEDSFRIVIKDFVYNNIVYSKTFDDFYDCIKDAVDTKYELCAMYNVANIKFIFERE